MCELNLASAQTQGHMENIHGVRVEDKRMKEWSDGSTYGSDDSMESAVQLNAIHNTSFPDKGNSIKCTAAMTVTAITQGTARTTVQMMVTAGCGLWKKSLKPKIKMVNSLI